MFLVWKWVNIWIGRVILSRKFNSACYAVRFIYQFSNVDTMKVRYFAYLYSIMNYGIIFWGNSTKGSFNYRRDL